MIRFSIALISLGSFLTACSQPAEKLDSATAADTIADAPSPAATPEPAPAPEPEPEPAVELPEGLPSAVHVWADIKVTEANTLNADENQFEIKGETRKSVVQVMNYYIKYFGDNGWEEDMIMEHEGNTVVSFKKDGILQYVDAKEGGYGCYVTITTGNY